MSNLNVGNAFQYDVNCNVHTLLYGYCITTKNKNLEHQIAMKVFFLHDVNSNVHIFFCRYYEETKNKNLKCQTSMKVMHFWVMLLLLYVF
jgi:hypothetical protein